MKAELNADGLMLITPESGLEAYALRQWIAGAYMIFEPTRECGCAMCELGAWKGSYLIVSGALGE